MTLCMAATSGLGFQRSDHSGVGGGGGVGAVGGGGAVLVLSPFKNSVLAEDWR